MLGPQDEDNSSSGEHTPELDVISSFVHKSDDCSSRVQKSSENEEGGGICPKISGSIIIDVPVPLVKVIKKKTDKIIFEYLVGQGLFSF